MNSEFYVAVMLLLVLAIVAAYDVYAGASGGKTMSISEVIWIWSTRWPVLPFSVGVLIGHLFWHTIPMAAH